MPTFQTSHLQNSIQMKFLLLLSATFFISACDIEGFCQIGADEPIHTHDCLELMQAGDVASFNITTCEVTHDNH